MREDNTGASAKADQALVASDQAASRLAPLGFDPSRCVDAAVLDAVADAIERAGCPGREGPYGLYDYSYNNPNPPEKPHRVRDFRDPGDATYGSTVFVCRSKALAENVYHEMTRRWIAYEAIRAWNAVIAQTPSEGL